MCNETELLVKAIEGLQQESNFFKDYMFPLVGAFFSALLGAGVAYLTLKYQEITKIEKEKMDSANNWILSVESAFSSLIALKSNYHNKLTPNPLQRAAIIPTIIFDPKPITEELSSLSFVIPKKEDEDSQLVKWRSITRIRSMVNNYNFLLSLWVKRNELERPIKEKIVHDFSDRAYADVTRDEIFSSVGTANYTALIDVTEKSLKFTDDLIIELNDFLTEFPSVAKTLINTNKLKHYGSLISFFSGGNEILTNLIVKVPDVDYDALAELYGRTAEQIKTEYSTGYE